MGKLKPVKCQIARPNSDPNDLKLGHTGVEQSIKVPIRETKTCGDVR